MKNLFTPLLALFLVVSLGSCDKVSDLADIDIPLEVSSENIDLSNKALGKTNGDTNFGKQSGKIDLFQGELKDYKSYTDKIRKFKATEITINVISVNPSTGVKFSNPSTAVITSNSGKKATLNFSDEEIVAGKKIVIDSKVLSVINEILNERSEFSYEVTGGFNQQAKAVIMISFKGKVTVNPLK